MLIPHIMRSFSRGMLLGSQHSKNLSPNKHQHPSTVCLKLRPSSSSISDRLSLFMLACAALHRDRSNKTLRVVECSKNTCLDHSTGHGVLWEQVTVSWWGMKAQYGAGMEWVSPLCETHECVKDRSTRAEEHFVKPLTVNGNTSTFRWFHSVFIKVSHRLPAVWESGL